MAGTVLILTADDDHAADRVSEALRQAEIATLRWDPGTVPSLATAGAWFEGGAWRWAEAAMPGRLRLDSAAAVWLRRPTGMRRSPSEDPVESFRHAETNSFLDGLFSILDVPWVNHPGRGRQATSKPLQLSVAAATGFRTPLTYFGNDPTRVAELWDRTRGRMVVKAHVATALPGPTGRRSLYTSPVSGPDIDDLEAIRAAPAIWQEYVEKDIELRVTVVGDEVLAGEIHSQRSDQTRHDWRRYDFDNVDHKAHSMPDAEAERCREIVRRFQVLFGAIDLVLTPAGEYVFLEINPFGEWAWMEDRCGLPITEAHCRLFRRLVELRPEQRATSCA